MKFFIKLSMSRSLKNGSEPNGERCRGAQGWKRKGGFSVCLSNFCVQSVLRDLKIGDNYIFEMQTISILKLHLTSFPSCLCNIITKRFKGRVLRRSAAPDKTF